MIKDEKNGMKSEETYIKHKTFLRKYVFISSLTYNFIWGGINAYLFLSYRNLEKCDEPLNWLIGTIIFNILCPLKNYLINIVEKICDLHIIYLSIVSLIISTAISISFVTGLAVIRKNEYSNDNCLSIISYQLAFLILESISIVFFILFMLKLYMSKDLNLENGMISIKTIE